MSKTENKRYTIECTKEQLMLISKCVEDCCRFAAGQTEMWNTASMLKNWCEIRDALRDVQKLVAPDLSQGASYSWNGGHCPNEEQRLFIAKCYPIYREILHFDALERGLDNTYASPTLTCAEGGEPVKVSAVAHADDRELAYLTGFASAKLKAQLWLEDELVTGNLIEGCRDVSELMAKFHDEIKE